MPWPQTVDYNSAIQNPSACFADEELARGQPAEGMFPGIPLSYAGNFATVYKMVGPSGACWAVKCFTRKVDNLQQRYQQISAHVNRRKRRFVVDFQYLCDGIRVGGEWYPVVKMQWVEGFTLNEFLRAHVGNPAILEQLCQLWLRLGNDMRDDRMAHGDLQHGNVLLVPGSSATSMLLRLVDYDGMWVPALAELPAGEVGHANYQHPARLAHGGYNDQIDRFSHLAIYTALRCLMVGGTVLWDEYDNQENILFREADFQCPAKSGLFARLLALPDAAPATLAAHLVLASQGPLAKVPAVNDLLAGSDVVPLSAEQIRRLRELIPPRLTASQGANIADLPPLPPLPPLTKFPASSKALLPPEWLLLLGFSKDAFAVRFWPVTLAAALAVACVPFFVLVVGLAWAFPRAPNAVASPAVSRLAEVPPITVRAGHELEIRVEVERETGDEPLTVRILGLPPTVSCTTGKLSPGDGSATVSMRLSAVPEAGEFDGDVRIQLRLQEHSLDEQSVRLTVSPVSWPELGPIRPITVEAGKTRLLEVPVKANGNTDPWKLDIADLPTGVQLRPSPRPAERGKAAVQIVADSSAPNVEGAIVRVTLLADGIRASSRLVSLSVERRHENVKIDLVLPKDIRLRAGEAKTFTVTFNRHGYEGPIRLEAEDLPSGVTARSVYVPAGAATASVQLRANGKLMPRLALQSFRLVALVDDRLVGTQGATFRLEQSARSDRPHPRDVSEPAIPEAWQEPVKEE